MSQTKIQRAFESPQESISIENYNYLPNEEVKLTLISRFHTIIEFELILVFRHFTTKVASLFS